MTRKNLKISSFNIRCFGTDGVYDGKIGTEGRITFLKDFIKKNLSDSDVLILQEIIDISILKKILPSNFKFKSYEHSFDRHMNVVICYKDCFILRDSQIIEGTAIDLKRSRPAFYGCLLDKEYEVKLAHVVGVHLKSGIYHTDNRLKQVLKIKEFLLNLSDNLPVIIGGDLNSHSKTATKKKLHDTELIENIFSTIDLKRVKNSNFTYYTQWERECLDHIWVSKDNLVEKDLWTYDIENHSPDFDTLYGVKTYYAEISDHLPISAVVKIN